MLRSALALTLAATLALAGGAEAAKPKAAKPKAAPQAKTTAYTVSWKGLATMTWAGDTQEEIGGSVEGGFDMRFTGKISRVVLRGNEIVSVSRPSSRGRLMGNTTEITWDRYSGTQNTNQCNGQDEVGVSFGSSAFSQQRLHSLTGDGMFVVRPFEHMEFTLPCSEGTPARWQLDALHPGGTEPEIGDGVFDASFELPEETLGMGKIIQRVYSKPGAPANCGIFLSMVNEHRTCGLTWQAEVTFRRLGPKKR